MNDFPKFALVCGGIVFDNDGNPNALFCNAARSWDGLFSKKIEMWFYLVNFFNVFLFYYQMKKIGIYFVLSI